MNVMIVMTIIVVTMAAIVIVSVLAIMCVLALIAATSMVYLIAHNDYHYCLDYNGLNATYGCNRCSGNTGFTGRN